MDRDPLDELERVLGHRFADRSLLDIARSHNPGGPAERMQDHRRLAFLGDLVWALAVGVHLYRAFPGAPVAELANLRAQLVGAPALVGLAERYGLPPLLRLGSAKKAATARIVAEAFEAVVGALYLDGGFAAVARLVEEGRRRDGTGPAAGIDPKSALQVLLQSGGRGTPRYRVLTRQGPSHAPSFTVQVLEGDAPLANGQGPSRREAEKDAAAEALRLLTHKT